MSGRSCFTLFLMVLIAVCARGQTSDNLAAKYPVVSAYKVRPGILMTAKYAEDGQVCEMVLERRYTPDQTDADSTIPSKLEEQLIDELAPTAERGRSASGQWLNNSFAAGGVTHRERDFENVLIEIDGTVSAGDKIVVIHWKKKNLRRSENERGRLDECQAAHRSQAGVNMPHRVWAIILLSVGVGVFAMARQIATWKTRAWAKFYAQHPGAAEKESSVQTCGLRSQSSSRHIHVATGRGGNRTKRPLATLAGSFFSRRSAGLPSGRFLPRSGSDSCPDPGPISPACRSRSAADPDRAVWRFWHGEGWLFRVPGVRWRG